MDARRRALAARVHRDRVQLSRLRNERRQAGRGRAAGRRARDSRRGGDPAGCGPARIVVFGRSLGTAVATHVASERSVAGAILVSPYDSLAAVGQHHYPWLPVSLLLRHRFNPVEDAARARAPLLAIVADGDSIIPPEHSRVLFDAWAGPKEWCALPRADHNTMGAMREFWDAIARFLANPKQP